jgi:hypothetical protein
LKKELQEVQEVSPLFDEAIFGPAKTVKKEEAPLTEADLFKDVGEKEKKTSESEPEINADGPVGTNKEEAEEPLDEEAGEEGETEEEAGESACEEGPDENPDEKAGENEEGVSPEESDDKSDI